MACLGTLNTLFPSVFKLATATLSVAMPLHIAGIMIGSRSTRGMHFFLVLLVLLASQIALSTQMQRFVIHPCAAVYLVWSASLAAGVVLGHLDRTRD